VFTDLISFPIENERLNWEARQVLRKLDQGSRVLTRLKLTGTFFPQYAQKPPFVAVGKVRSRFVRFAGDGLSAYAYFDAPLPGDGRVEFGYGKQAMLRFPKTFAWDDVEFLDRH
jgi:hypothetical protein